MTHPETAQKPPIGITPIGVHEDKRIMELIGGIHRYVNADHKVPEEWLAELEVRLQMRRLRMERPRIIAGREQKPDPAPKP